MPQGDQTQMQVQAGWFPDPHGGGTDLRYWDGSAWTQHTSPRIAPSARGASFPVLAVVAVTLASLAWFLGFVTSDGIPAVVFLLVLSAVSAIVLGVVGIVRGAKRQRGFTTSVVATVMGGLIVLTGLSVFLRG